MVSRSARESIEYLLGLMRVKLIEAGIPKSQIRLRSGSFLISKCAAAYDFLHEIYISRDYEIGGKILLAAWKKNRPQMFGKDRPSDTCEIFNAGDYCQ
jgi:hypothetical protein